MALDVYKDWLGIPDGPRPPDHYTLLRLVQFEDNTEKIRELPQAQHARPQVRDRTILDSLSGTAQ